MTTADIVFWLSLAGFAVLTILGYTKTRNAKQSLLWLALLATCGVAYALAFQSSPHVQPKGGHSSDWIFMAVLYGFMLLGMACNYLYNFFMKAGRQRFDARRLLAPVFVSRMIFAPLFGAFQNTDINLATLTLPKYMVFFVAFENGFLWKQAFDSRSSEQKP